MQEQRSCPSLHGCYLTDSNGDRVSGDLLVPSIVETVAPGVKWNFVCNAETDGGGTIQMYFHRQVSSFSTPPYKYEDISVACEELQRIAVVGWSNQGMQCFQRTYTIKGDFCGARKDVSAASICPSFRCPMNARPIPGLSCTATMDDCFCLDGFKKNTLTQRCERTCPDFQCPANSHRRNNGRRCLSSFQDCRCDRGFRRSAGRCVPKCPFTYTCPAHSSRDPQTRCVRGFSDCLCEDGWVADHTSGACVIACPNYQCPSFSSPKDGTNCIASFDDCECHSGYVKDSNRSNTCIGAVFKTKNHPDACQLQELADLMDQAVRTNKALAPQWLRLAFHDAGTYDQRHDVGGPNGCLLTDPRMRLEPENANLDLALQPLQLIRETWSGEASAADLIQFAGLFAVIRQRGAPGWTDTKRRELEESFAWGRPDELNCQTEWTHNLPEFQLEVDDVSNLPARCQTAGAEIQDKMMDRNGFSAFEATALIGAHTIGLTRHVFSEELAGPWSRTGHDDASPQGPIFDNDFHKFLIEEVEASTVDDFADRRHPFDVDFPNWFRFEEADINHLDTDVVLAFPAADRRVHPDYHMFTAQFASDNNFFLESFMQAFHKMSRLGVTARLVHSPPCPQLLASAVVQDRKTNLPYQLNLQTSITEANIMLQETAWEHKEDTEYLTTPIG